jgi:hypothetical protein
MAGILKVQDEGLKSLPKGKASRRESGENSGLSKPKSENRAAREKKTVKMPAASSPFRNLRLKS